MQTQVVGINKFSKIPAFVALLRILQIDKFTGYNCRFAVFSVCLEITDVLNNN